MASNTQDKNYGYKRVVNICMIGPSGVGKTSLLATMHKTLQKSLGGSLKFEPLNDFAFKVLRDKYTSLGRMIDKPAATRVVNLGVGTTRIQEYPFGLDHVDSAGNREKIALVNFFDTPGAMTRDLSEELKEKIAESQIVINAIDTGVMMKLEGPDAEEFNGYDAVKRLLDEHVFTENSKNKLVIFTLIKAETWIMDRGNEKVAKSDWNFLLRKLNEHLSEMFSLFPPEAPRLAVICPVETLGCVEFSMVTKHEEGYPEIHYKRVYGKKFDPKHVQIPLYYALRFILAEWSNGRGFLERFWDKHIGSYFSDVLNAICRMDADMIDEIGNSTAIPMEHGNEKLLIIEE